MQVSFVLGPAGSGKSHRCLEEARRLVAGAPDGLPLLFVAPKQATYEVERRLLEAPDITGYTRLQVLSFERLARFVFDQLGRRPPDLLDEQGRVMVLRSLLSRNRDQLKLFRASAKLTGFASQLSTALAEAQRQQLTPDLLRQLAASLTESPGLACKLQDLATLLAGYSEWLVRHGLLDDDSLVGAAAAALSPKDGDGELLGARRRLTLERVWVDGFFEFTGLELELLAALAPCCQQMTITFCLDRIPGKFLPWLSHWAPSARSFLRCREKLSAAGAEVRTVLLERSGGPGRFASSQALAHVESCWSEPRSFGLRNGNQALRVVSCEDPEAEVKLATREVLRLARSGGRFRDISVFVRSLERYRALLQREFAACDIPFFVDHRESVAHHPLAELTRGALRATASHWNHEDLFALLKTGLAPIGEEEVDLLENEALARGWRGRFWDAPAALPGEADLERRLRQFHREVLAPLRSLALVWARGRATGPELAQALRAFWEAFDVEATLKTWAAEPGSGGWDSPAAVHSTVWEQANLWVENVELAFAGDALTSREWLPILEAGLAGLSVGVIPPALDQVMVGAIDRSRTPESRLVILLGCNEGVFPAAPDAPVLLSEADRVLLEGRGLALGGTLRQHLGRERFLAYVACTRAKERLLVTFAKHDSEGIALNPSSLISKLRQLFPNLEIETAPRQPDWREAEHPSELVAPLLEAQMASGGRTPGQIVLPALAETLKTLQRFTPPSEEEKLPPELAEGLYGMRLQTSVSRLEQFAACPFRFFVHSGLRAEERLRFELDARERGSFQHDVLALFHEQVTAEGKRWRDLTPEEAAQRVGRIAADLARSYRDGLLQASDGTRFASRLLGRSLERCVATLVRWMREQYRFDPARVELPFGEEDGLPAWKIDLGQGRALELRGRIDRLDIFQEPGSNETLCLVLDYKSSHKELEDVLLANGLQLQLLAYLGVVRHVLNNEETFGAARLVPIGVFYLNLRGNGERKRHRAAALEGVEEAQKLAYTHHGRFDRAALPLLDARPGARMGDQFCYRLTNDGDVYANSKEAMETTSFRRLADSVEGALLEMGRRVFAGEIKVDPYKRGKTTACLQCEFQSICRIDPWTHVYRKLVASVPATAG